MSQVAVQEPPERAQLRSAGRLFDPGGRPTLDDVVTALWDDDPPGECPVCGAALPAAAKGGAFECPSCGSCLE
jgi:hypothetical protein